MLDELCAPVIQVLAMQYATRILDYHLGNYELEEGEIIDYEVTLDELRAIAERIVLGADFHKVEEEEEDDDDFSDYENEEGEEDPKEDLYMHLYME